MSRFFASRHFLTLLVHQTPENEWVSVELGRGAGVGGQELGGQELGAGVGRQELRGSVLSWGKGDEENQTSLSQTYLMEMSEGE